MMMLPLLLLSLAGGPERPQSPSTAEFQIGAVSVTDQRGSLLGSWTASVTSSDFTTGTQTAEETIAKANVSYWSGAATASTGVGVFAPGQATETLYLEHYPGMCERELGEIADTARQRWNLAGTVIAHRVG